MIRLTKQKSKHPEELVKKIINEKLDGASNVFLAQKYDVSVRMISSWATGNNRGHLLDAVLDQRHKEGKL